MGAGWVPGIQKGDTTYLRPQGVSPVGLWDLQEVSVTRMLGLGEQPQALLGRIQEVSGPGNCCHLQPSVQLPCKTESGGHPQHPGSGVGLGVGMGGRGLWSLRAETPSVGAGHKRVSISYFHFHWSGWCLVIQKLYLRADLRLGLSLQWRVPDNHWKSIASMKVTS